MYHRGRPGLLFLQAPPVVLIQLLLKVNCALCSLHVALTERRSQQRVWAGAVAVLASQDWSTASCRGNMLPPNLAKSVTRSCMRTLTFDVSVVVCRLSTIQIPASLHTSSAPQCKQWAAWIAHGLKTEQYCLHAMVIYSTIVPSPCLPPFLPGPPPPWPSVLIAPNRHWVSFLICHMKDSFVSLCRL